jgi:prepilin-type N-terminal cleavage/methylation domain-containing protein
MRSGEAARGFTLIELACVVAIISILISASVPVYRVYLDRARSAEAVVNVETIAHLEHLAFLETGAFVACAPNPEALPRPKAPFRVDEAWDALGFRPTSQVRFRYAVEVDRDAERFVVRAEGDVDGDGRASAYTIDSRAMQLQIERPGD